MELNEEIVKEYFCSVKQCFIQENILYKVTSKSKNGKKSGSGWSDIDLLAYSPKVNEFLDIEVKYREVAPFHRGKDKASNLDKVINNFTLESRISKIEELNPNSLSVKRIFVTNRKAFTNKKRDEYEGLLKENNIELIYFETVFQELQSHFQKNSKKMTSVLGQVLRIINNQNNSNESV